jgi:hypothetical protein
MKPLPADPIARHGRFIAALCDDLASPDFRDSGQTPRADACVAASRRTSSEAWRGRRRAGRRN